MPRSSQIILDNYPRTRRHGFAMACAGFAMIAAFVEPAVGLMLLIPLFAVLGCRSELHLDVDERRYRTRRGIWPFGTFREGSFAELQGVYVDCVHSMSPVATRPYGPMTRISTTYQVSLLWIGVAVDPWFLSSSTSLTDAINDATTVSKQLGIPIVTSQALEILRNDVEALRSDFANLP